VPTPTGSNYLNVIVNSPTLNAVDGQTTSYNCVFTVQSALGAGKAYNVTDWGYGTSTKPSAGSFPVLNYTQNSDVSWSLDSSTTYTLLADSGAPGQTLYQVNPSTPQTHCVNLKIAVPSSQAVGTYPASIQFNLYANSSAAAGASRGSEGGERHAELETLVTEVVKTVNVVVAK